MLCYSFKFDLSSADRHIILLNSDATLILWSLGVLKLRIYNCLLLRLGLIICEPENLELNVKRFCSR